MLQVMVLSMPPAMQSAVRSASIETSWSSAGLKVGCKLQVGPQSVRLEQTIPFDQRDVEHARLSRSMAELYAEVKERLASLSQCATDEEMGRCVERCVCA